jgi:pseudouridine-5'-phosphate glycosidase
VSTGAPIRIGQRVREALRADLPVVALESTVITHGLPRPRNLEAAQRLESVVEEAGAVPATIGVLAGEVVVGLDANELEHLARADAEKVSLWNLAAVVARRADAGTTVAVTLWAAHQAGLDVFATGGIGGVHDVPFDESADISALARFPVLTVCAGPKSILDASATLERLETAGVPVVGYRSSRLAGFILRETDLPLPARVDSPEEAAAVLQAQRRLGLSSGVVLSNPVSSGLAPDEFAALRERAEEELRARGVRGRDATPFLLAELARISGGRTVEVNTRLLEENAALAAQVAAACRRLAGDTRPVGGRA